MLIKTPQFWTKKNLISYFLLPLSFLYLLIYQVKSIFTKPKSINKKIVCIGNLTVGGSGKTPVACAIGRILKENNINFTFLIRGYKGKKKFGFIEDNSANNNGDEAIILSEIAPVFISNNRLRGAVEISKYNDVEYILCDDGLQNNSLKFDHKILVIDGNVKFGNGFLFPAGNLREPVSLGLKKVDLIIVIGKIDHDLQLILHKNKIGAKIISAFIVPLNLNNFKGKKLFAFCGIAYPQKFFSLIQQSGLDLVRSQSFPDHYFYTDQELEKICQIAEDNNLTPVATKKDWVKFSPDFQKKIEYLDIELQFQDKNDLLKYFNF